MDRRTRVLAVAAAVVVGAFVLDKLFTSLWWRPWTEVGTQIADVDRDLEKADSMVRRRASVEKGWKKIRDLLDKPRMPDVQNHFYATLDSLCDRVGVNPDIQGGTSQQRGDFKEYVYDLKLKLSWAQFVDLLAELHNSREFVKPLRIGIGSLYEKEDRMDVDLKVSTIAYAPAPSKAGGK